MTGVYDKMSNQQKDFMDKLEPLNIEARYPAHKDALAASLNEDICKTMLQRTEELRQWIKQQLSIT
jgi:hypothetical protein